MKDSITKIMTIFFLFMILLLSACSSDTLYRSSAMYKGLSEKQLFEKGELAMAEKDYKDALALFESLDARYPFSQYSEQAQLNSIYAYYRTGDRGAAAAAADRFIKLFPRSKRVDYAYYMKGVANFEQDRGFIQRFVPTDKAERDPGTTREAFVNFKVLLELFPDSQYAADARARMLYLRDMLARHEMHVAKYYYRRGAYVAAVNRANVLLQYYPQSRYSEEAMVMLVKGNRELQLPQAEKNAMKMLTLNFPESQALSELQK